MTLEETTRHRAKFISFVPRSSAFIYGALASLAVVVLFGATAASVTTSAPARKCVGVFVSGERRNVAADAKSLVVVGTVSCQASVMAWSMQGVYRAFDDGAVEFLAVPMPPCQDGDAYVWIRFPNP